VDYKDDPEWKQWRKAALRKVFLKDDADDYDDGTKATTTSEKRRELVHKSMKKCRMAATAASAASASASATSSQKSGGTGSSTSCQTYRTPAASSQSSNTTHVMTTPLDEVMTPVLYEVCGGNTTKTGGEMTQEQKAKAYDAFMRGSNQSKKEMGCAVRNHQGQPGRTPPPLPEEIVMPTDNVVEEDDGSSTLVSILGPATQNANLF
jgi:hypothetical protein